MTLCLKRNLKKTVFFYGGRETWMKMSEVELKITNKLPEAIFVWGQKMAQCRKAGLTIGNQFRLGRRRDLI